MKSKKSSRNRKLGGRQSSCGTEQVNDTCLENAVNSLNFEKNQIQNFYKQKARLTNHNKTKSNKLGKKGEFADAAKYLLQALGGNISAPTCGEVGKAQKARSAKSASDTYGILTNCSESIKEACTMPKKTFNATMKEKLDNCAFIFNKSKTAANDCRTNKDYISNGTAACSCWAKAAIGITEAKKEGCSAEQTAKDVKAAKNRCFKAFSACKKAEDAAVGLIHTCMAGEVKNISATGTGSAPSAAPSAAPAPASPTPSTDRTCPSRTLVDKCNINCGDSSPQCTGQNSGSSFSSSSVNNVFETTWTMNEGAEGATCTLNCKDADLDVKTTCSWNGQKMEWTKPDKLVAKCGGN